MENLTVDELKTIIEDREETPERRDDARKMLGKKRHKTLSEKIVKALSLFVWFGGWTTNYKLKFRYQYGNTKRWRTMFPVSFFNHRITIYSKWWFQFAPWMNKSKPWIVVNLKHKYVYSSPDGTPSHRQARFLLGSKYAD